MTDYSCHFDFAMWLVSSIDTKHLNKRKDKYIIKSTFFAIFILSMKRLLFLKDHSVNSEMYRKVTEETDYVDSFSNTNCDLWNSSILESKRNTA